MAGGWAGGWWPVAGGMVRLDFNSELIENPALAKKKLRKQQRLNKAQEEHHFGSDVAT